MQLATPDGFRWQLQVLALTCAACWKSTLSPQETAQTGDLVELVESMLGVHIIVWNGDMSIVSMQTFDDRLHLNEDSVTV